MKSWLSKAGHMPRMMVGVPRTSLRQPATGSADWWRYVPCSSWRCRFREHVMSEGGKVHDNTIPMNGQNSRQTCGWGFVSPVLHGQFLLSSGRESTRHERGGKRARSVASKPPSCPSQAAQQIADSPLDQRIRNLPSFAAPDKPIILLITCIEYDPAIKLFFCLHYYAQSPDEAKFVGSQGCAPVTSRSASAPTRKASQARVKTGNR